MQPTTHYAKSGDIHVAYQVFGEGSINAVLAPFFVSNIENFWDEPDFARWLLRLASYARVAMFDKRGTGMSDKVTITELPGLDQRMDDLRAVMDAAGMQQAALIGISEGGPLSALFAATYPERRSALVLCGSFARFSSWFPTEESLEQFLGYIDQAWGSGTSLPYFAPSRANDAAFQRWWGRFERLGASPAAVTALMRMNSQIDISEIVSTIRVPTLVIHRTEDVTVNVEGGRACARPLASAATCSIRSSFREDRVPAPRSRSRPASRRSRWAPIQPVRAVCRRAFATSSGSNQVAALYPRRSRTGLPHTRLRIGLGADRRRRHGDVGGDFVFRHRRYGSAFAAGARRGTDAGRLETWHAATRSAFVLRGSRVGGALRRSPRPLRQNGRQDR